MTASPTIRRDLRPGDLGAIVAHHGADLPARVRPRLDASRRTSAASVAAAGKRGFPRPSEGVWIVEVDGRHAGSLALTDEGDGLGAVRWFVLDRELRGQGLGRRLVAELVAEAEAARLRRASSSRRSATCAPPPHIYRSHGFELPSARDRPALGPRRAHLPALRAQLPGARPVAQLGERRLERAALLGQRVGDARRRSRRGPSARPGRRASSSRRRRESRRSERPGTLAVSSAK